METIKVQIDKYSKAFDYYLEKGVLPEDLSDDLLANYMKTVLDDPGNHNLCLNDPIWRELLLTSILEFFRVILPQMDILEQEKRKEIDYINHFDRGDIKLKRIMWKDIMEYITKHYSPAEININGYVYLMQHSTYSKDDIFSSMIRDWKKTCNNRIEREKHLILTKNQRKFEEWTVQVGQKDYEIINKTAQILYKYPQLEEILQIMGREKKKESREMDITVTRYIPILLAHSTSHEEIEGIKTGDELNMLLPTEIALLNTSITAPIFYHKFVCKQLQSFACKPPVMKKEKVERDTSCKPRLQEGPLIISIDTSASMNGKPEEISKSLLMQILQMAKKKKRKCFLITFSIHTHILEISKAANWRKVKEFMQTNFTGGTDGEQMLNDILETLKTKNYSMADALIISDFEFAPPLNKTKEAIIKEQKKGTRFYGLQIGKTSNIYKNILDRIWEISKS